MLIEVNITQTLPDIVTVLDPMGREFELQVEYDWKPKFFLKCSVVGHKCPDQEKQDLKNVLP